MSLRIFCLLAWHVEVHGFSLRLGGDVDEEGESLPLPMSNLQTRWGAEVEPSSVWPEHPRPTMVRSSSWTNLNGLWQYKVSGGSREFIGRGGLVEEWRSMDASRVRAGGQILVPFSIESNLSGVGRRLGREEALFYQTPLRVVPKPTERYILHFESVDYECAVMINGKEVGTHTGGNSPFEFDVTSQLAESGQNDLVVAVRDMMSPYQIMGKQSQKGGKIWYSPSSGIRGTVWLEAVPRTFIKDLRIVTNARAGTIQVEADIDGSLAVDVSVKVMDDGVVAMANCARGERCLATVHGAKLWSPSKPFLYAMSVELVSKGSVVDAVQSYAGIRTVGKKRDAHGKYRFTLNDEFIFHYGVLDQGWWPDGGLTPPSDAAMRFDVDFVKKSGFNVIRKHAKVEPRRFYAYCDKVGIMVWQDQPAAPGCEAGHTPCSDEARAVSPGGWETRIEKVDNFRDQREARWPPSAHDQFLAELNEMMSTLGNNPSIVVWTPFNEAWGQHRTVEVGELVKRRDPTRLVNVASGGNFWPAGDIVDRHSYPKPKFDTRDKRFEDYVRVVGEFGGHSLTLSDHRWNPSAHTFGYSHSDDRSELLTKYNTTYHNLDWLVRNGVAGAIYTQTTDVEGELNGLLTYDREVEKIEAEELRQVHAGKLGKMNLPP